MNNRKRIFAEVLSIDAWHDPFKVDGTTSGVFVEMSFHQGRVGGNDPLLPFTFKISLKRALLTIHTESPLKIKKNSVARDIPDNPVEMSKIISAKNSVRKSAAAKGELNAKSFGAAFSGSITADAEASRDQQFKVVQQIPRIIAMARPKGDQHYAWDLQPTYEEFLDGQPWDPTGSPRLRVRHPQERQSIDPFIKVSLACSLEDVSITDLVPKPAGVLETIMQAALNEVSYAAAVQYLKKLLILSDLQIGSIDNRFSEIVLADVLSKEEDGA